MIGVFRRLRARIRHRHFAIELEQELDAHRAMIEDDARSDGASVDEARRRAAKQLGSVTLAREFARGVWIAPWLESLWQDVRYAIRDLRRQSGFSVVALLILTLSIGPVATLFTLVSDTVLKPWSGVANAERVIRIYGVDRGRQIGLSHPEYRYLSDHSTSAAALIAWRNETVRLNDQREAGTRITIASGNFFQDLGIPIARGRGLQAADDTRGRPQPVAVVSANLWETAFASDPAVVGREIRLDGVPFEIVGVASTAFAASEGAAASVWIPFGAIALLRPGSPQVTGIEDPGNCCSQVAGRLAAGASQNQAELELERLSSQFRASVRLEDRPIAVSGTSFLPAREARTMLTVAGMMFAALFLVVLLASANIGNLLLAKAAVRRREISVRLSLGATRRRVVRQLLTESLVLALIAGATSLLVATQLAPVLGRLVSVEGPTPEAGIDWVVLAATFAIAGIACLAFGLAPALHATRVPLMTALRADGATSRRVPLRSVLLGTQVAITVLFLSCASLFLRGVQQARTLDLGFAMNNTDVVTFDFPADAYDTGRKGVFLRTFADQLASADGLPIGLVDWEPFEGSSASTAVRLPGQGVAQAFEVSTTGVSAGYFEVLNIPIVAGRNFSATDTGVRPVLVNETLARRLWPNEGAVGKTYLSGSRDPVEHVVVGVVKDARTARVDGVEPTFYRVLDGAPGTLLVRGDDVAARTRVAGIASGIDSRVRVQVRPLADSFDGEIAPSRRSAAIAGALGSLTLALALVGMFGVFAYAVEQRTREFGVRIALGARSLDVIALVLSGNARPVILGIAFGFLGGIASARLLRHLLFGVSPFDPVALAGVAGVVALAAFAASGVPVLRAIRLDPVQALRHE